MKNSSQKHTGFRKATKYLIFSLGFAVLGTALILILSYPGMKEFKKNWLSLDCTWGDTRFKSQYIGKMHIWKTPGGSYPCEEENGYVKCLIIDREDFYAGRPVHVKVYGVFKKAEGEVGFMTLFQAEGIPENYLSGYCAQLDAVYDKEFGGCLKKEGVCRVQEVQF